MGQITGQIQAVTFDFYRTLVDHRGGIGRGRLFQQYLASRRLQADSWDRQVLYEVFDYYADAYEPGACDDEKRSFWIEFTRRLFQKTNVTDYAHRDIESHAEAIRDIFGPSHFKLYAEVKEVLQSLKGMGLRLGVISNWQRGLTYFCEELGILPNLDVVISSAEVGCEKPDPRMFQKAVLSLQVSPEHALHIGDSLEDDVRGATRSGLNAVLVDREDTFSAVETRRIRNLGEIETMLG